MNENNKNLYKIAYAFAIVTCVIWAVFLIPLAWCIPMTIAIKNARDEQVPQSHLTLGICSLFFLSTVSGVLILVATPEEKTYQNNDQQKLEQNK